MGSIAKYKDRFPEIKAAGVRPINEDSVRDLLINISPAEILEHYATAEYKKQKIVDKSKLFIGGRAPLLPESDLKFLLTTELQKSRFVKFREELSENIHSHNALLGKSHKPDYINENMICGIKSGGKERSESLYDVVLPKKTPQEVNREFAEFHEKYVLSHRHYFPGERINRKYKSKYFNHNYLFGSRPTAHLGGTQVKRCLNQSDHVLIVNSPQKRILDKKLGLLGKTNANMQNDEYTQPLGVVTEMDKCDVKALIEGSELCLNKTKLIEAIAYVNQLRHKLFRANNTLHISDLKTSLEMRDVNKTGYLPINVIFEVARKNSVRINEEKMRTALSHYQLIENEGLCNERLSYDKFCKLIQMRYLLPKTGNIAARPDNNNYKTTVYRELCQDLSKNIQQFQNTKRYRTQAKPEVAELLSPTTIMHAGLEQSDFDAPRNKEQLRIIFRPLLTDDFDEVWQRAKEKLKPHNDLISIEELREAMHVPKVEKSYWY